MIFKETPMFSQTSQSLPDTLLSFPVCPVNYTSKSMHLNYPWLKEKFLLSGGALYLADKARAFWLVDAIAAQQKDEQLAATSFQVWELVVEADHKVVLTGADSSNHFLARQEFSQTSFPIERLRLIVVKDASLGGRMLLLYPEYQVHQFSLRQGNHFPQTTQPAWAI
jgi:hypothetical protein